MAKFNDKPHSSDAQGQIDSLEQQVKQLTGQLKVRDQQLATASVQLLQAQHKIEERTADLFMLEELGRYLTSSLAYEQVIENVCDSFSVLEGDLFLLGLLDEHQQTIQLTVIDQQQEPRVIDIALDGEVDPVVWCVQNKKELLIFDPLDHAKFHSAKLRTLIQGEPMNSVVYQPLVVGDKVLGCLSLQHLDEQAYCHEQIEIIRTLASYSAIAIANARGYTELAQTHQALINTQKQLMEQEKMASLGTLTAGVAHEINNPINFAHVSAENLAVDLLSFEAFLLELAGKEAEHEILKAFEKHFKQLFAHITTIKRGTRRIKGIVQDLRTFTQLDNSQRMSVDIAQCITSTINLIQTQYLDVTKFVTQLQTACELVCFPAQLNQVFMNILVNACDAIREKQQKQDSVQPGQIDISCQMLDKMIVITFKDNGCGMSELTKNKVFEPFFTTKTVGQGTGLGMATSFGIIKNHGGTIEVESSEGSFTCISVYLPRQDLY